MPLIRKLLTLFIFLSFLSIKLIAQNFVTDDPFQDHFFIENKGQFPNVDGQPVLFELTDKMDKIFILKDGFLWLKKYNHIDSSESKNETTTIRNVFKGCNINSKVSVFGKSSHYFSYGQSTSNSFGFSKVVFANFYPNIDLIYEFGKSGEGIKYSFKVNSGGDPSQILFEYVSSDIPSIDYTKTKLSISNSIFSLTDSELKVFGKNREVLKAYYGQKDKYFTYLIPGFKKGLSVTIDPWVKSFNNLNKTHNIYSESFGENIGFDVDFDSKGNVYVYGGCPLSGNQSKVAKYDINGNLKWVFQGEVFIPIHMKMWYSTGGYSTMGSFIVDRTNDKLYLSDGWGMPKVGNLIIRLDSNGNSDSFLIHHPGLTTANKFMFRCDPHRVVAFGGFNHNNYWSNLFEILDTSIYKPKAFTQKKLNQYEMIIDAATDDSNKVYVLLKAYSPPYHLTNNSNNVDVLAKLSDSLNSSIWYDTLITKINQYSIKPYVPTKSTTTGTVIGNSTNSIVATKNYIYYYDGKFIAAYNKSTGSLICLDSLNGSKQSFQQGIVADNCGNVIVGSDSGRLQVFKFNGSVFSWIKNIVVFPNTERCILDLIFDKNRNVLVFSGDSMAGVISNPVDCESSKTTEFFVYPNKRCSNFAYAQIKFADTTKSYTFTWYDSTTNKIVKKVTKFKEYRDTFFNRIPSHSYLVSIKQEDGCYSMVSNFWLYAIPKYDTTINITLCNGALFKHKNYTYSRDTNFIDSIKTYFGCDSLVRYKIVFNTHSLTSQDLTICRGDTLWVGKFYHTSTGDYSDTLNNFKGCDSIVNTKLYVAFDSVFQYRRVCNDSIYKVGNNIYKISGHYIDTLTNRFGCDSLVYTHLIISRDTTINGAYEICRGGVIKVGNKVYHNSGTYIDSFKRISGCDSIIITRLTVNEDTLIKTKASICEGDTIKVGKHSYTQPDIYYDTLNRVTGCDSVIITEIKVLKTNDTVNRIILCKNDSVLINGKFYSSSNNLNVVFKNANGCDSTVTYNIIKNDVIASFEIDSTKNPYFEFKNQSQGDVKFYWDFGDLSVDSSNRNTSHNYKNDVTYWASVCLKVTDTLGCIDTICKRIQISKLLYNLFNSFTPGNDGKNDVFKIGYKGGTFNYNLMVYNRWGVLVYETTNANVSDDTKFWNGKVMNSGLECPAGSYFVIYQLYLNGPNNPPKQVNGVITLLRNVEE
jgi:gliding motility-associated-like protein